MIATIYTSKRVFPAKNVPFCGLDNICPHLGGQTFSAFEIPELQALFSRQIFAKSYVGLRQSEIFQKLKKVASRMDGGEGLQTKIVRAPKYRVTPLDTCWWSAVFRAPIPSLRTIRLSAATPNVT